MKNLNFTYTILIALFILSCSTNDNDDKNDNNDGFQIGNKYFNTPHVYLNDENTSTNDPSDLAIILSNKYLLVENIESGVDYLYIDYRGVDFEIGEKELLDYRITENASRKNNLMNGGTRLLDNAYNSGLNATQISFEINSLSSTDIDLEYSFTREDGVIISGNYSGEYINVSDE